MKIHMLNWVNSKKIDKFNGNKKRNANGKRMKHTAHCVILNDSWTKKGEIAQINCKKWLSILGINFTFARRLLNASMQMKWRIWKLPESVWRIVCLCVSHYIFSCAFAFPFVGKSFYEGNLVYFLFLFFSCKRRWVCAVCVCNDVRMFLSAPREWKEKRWKHTHTRRLTIHVHTKS